MTVTTWESADGELVLRRWFGDEDSVVAVVAAVRGLSPECDMEDIAAWEDGGSLPVNSSLRIRDLRSSSSSQTMDGAFVDNVDSVPSCRVFSGSVRTCSGTSELAWRLLRMVDSEGLPLIRGSCNEERLSTPLAGVCGEVSGLVRLINLLRGTPMEDLELGPIAYRDRVWSSRG